MGQEQQGFQLYQPPSQQKTKEQPVDYSGQINNFASRLRLLEERYSMLQRRTQLTDKNMLDHAKNLHTEMKTISQDILEMKKELNDINEKTKVLVRDITLLAPREEIEILKKYITYWDPLKFVTRNEVDKMIQEALEEKDEK